MDEMNQKIIQLYGSSSKKQTNKRKNKYNRKAD